jgi:hypothetical protein
LNHFLLRFRKDILYKTVAAAVVTGFCVACLAGAANDNWTVSRQTLYAVYLTGGRGWWHPIFSLLPIITSCLPLLGYLSDDMAMQATYVMSRSGKQLQWIWRQYGMLFLYIICSAFVYLATIVATLTLFGQSKEAELNYPAFYGQLLVLTCLYWLFFVLLINLCALRFPTMVALLAGIIFTAALAWVSPKSPIIFAVPMVHYYLDIHASSAWYAGIQLENAPYAKWLTWSVSLAYYTILLALLGMLGQMIVHRTEFALSKKARGKE